MRFAMRRDEFGLDAARTVLITICRPTVDHLARVRDSDAAARAVCARRRQSPVAEFSCGKIEDARRTGGD
jgi:hypothetical protein